MNRINFEKRWRDAATLVIAVKSGGHTNPVGNSFKVLMLQRHEKSKFMPSSYVFPGGVISSADFKKEWIDVLPTGVQRSLDIAAARPYIYTSTLIKNGLQPELAFRICALRETFEESGILLITNDKGDSEALTDPDTIIGGKYGTLEAWREKVNDDANNFLELFSCSKLFPNIYNLFEWSTWLTPAFKKISRRFDTIFYICLLPDIQPPSKVDKCEVVDTLWCSPNDFLVKHRDVLPPPQVYELARMQRFNSWNDLREFVKYREQLGLEMWCPYQISLNDGCILTYPGDDYHQWDPNRDHSHLECTIDELRNVSTNINRQEVSKTHGHAFKSNYVWYGHLPIEIEYKKSYNFRLMA